MTDAEREKWKALQMDYHAALKIANASWPADTPPEVLQAATATLLIAFDRRGGGPALPAAPAAGTDAPSEGPVHVCPKCSGPLWDNRAANLERKLAGKKPLPRVKCRSEACGYVDWGKK